MKKRNQKKLEEAIFAKIEDWEGERLWKQTVTEWLTNKPVGELARALLSFKRPHSSPSNCDRLVLLRLFVIRNFHLGV